MLPLALLMQLLPFSAAFASRTPFFSVEAYRLGSVGMAVRRVVSVKQKFPFRIVTRSKYGSLCIAGASRMEDIMWAWDSLFVPLSERLEVCM